VKKVFLTHIFFASISICQNLNPTIEYFIPTYISADTLFNITGEAPGDKFGGLGKPGCDVNSDGYGDLLIQAKYNDEGGVDAGKGYIFFGGPTFDEFPDLEILGENSGDGLSDISFAGDLNSDGFADFKLTAPYNNDAGEGAGKAYIYFGGPDVDDIADITILGENSGDNFGEGGYVGDVNGDGNDDILLFAILGDGDEINSGISYLFFGGPNFCGIPDVVFKGEFTGDRFGRNQSTAGDINDDGYDDIVIGAYQHSSNSGHGGKAYVYLGADTVDNIPDLIISGNKNNGKLGWAVDILRDVNLDGYDDFIVTAPFEDVGSIEKGKAYIYFGGKELDNIPDLILFGEIDGDRFGIEVESAEDLNGDGFGDIILSSPNNWNGQEIDRAYIFFGGLYMDNIPDIIIEAEEAGDNLRFVAPCGDINFDGNQDIVLGAVNNDAGGENAGRSYIYSIKNEVLGAPSNLLTRVDSNNVVITWEDNSNNEDGFEIERKSPGELFYQIAILNANVKLYTDENIGLAQGLCYRVRAFSDLEGKFSDFSNESCVVITNTPNLSEANGIRFSLSQNYPNPFNPATKIRYTIPPSVSTEKVNVRIVIYDILAREVKTLFNEIQENGSHEVAIDGSNLPSGIYYYKLQYGDFSDTKKMLLLK